MHARQTLTESALCVAWQLIALAILAATCHAQDRTVTVSAPIQRIVSPLYFAEIDCEKRMLRQMVYVVRATDVVRPVPNHIEREWWQHERAEPFALEDSDYNGSGYQRGHVRPILLSSGRKEWADVNCTAVIVPQWPLVNSPIISGIEDHIADLSKKVGQVTVIVDVRFSDGPMVKLPEADEPCEVPSGFKYAVLWREGKRNRDEQYEVPNVETPPSLDWRDYEVK